MTLESPKKLPIPTCPGCADCAAHVNVYGDPKDRTLARKGDEILTLLDEHGARLFAMLTRLTLRAEVAEDLMQELFCKLAHSKGFHRANDPAAYAFRSAANLAMDYRRSQKRAASVESLITDTPGRDGSPLVDMVRREEFERILDAIARLPRASRAIVILRHVEQQSYETIAQQLSKTPHQVRALCHKGIARLRDMLGEGASAEPERKES